MYYDTAFKETKTKLNHNRIKSKHIKCDLISEMNKRSTPLGRDAAGLPQTASLVTLGKSRVNL